MRTCSVQSMSSCATNAVTEDARRGKVRLGCTVVATQKQYLGQGADTWHAERADMRRSFAGYWWAILAASSEIHLRFSATTPLKPTRLTLITQDMRAA